MRQRQRLECRTGRSCKFWEVEIARGAPGLPDTRLLTIRWGRVGSGGQSTSILYRNEEEARKDALRRIGEKMDKGYTPC